MRHAPNRAEQLAALHLLRKEPLPDEPLRTLCDHGYLMGGLSIALDVKTDEALGPLLDELGAGRLVRVRDIQGNVFSVSVGTQDHEWEIEGLESLVDTLNRAFASHPKVKALALLGEWQDALQVWALPKPVVVSLEKHDWFRPSNPVGLNAALGRWR